MTSQSKFDGIIPSHECEQRESRTISRRQRTRQTKQYSTISRKRCYTTLVFSFIATAYALAPSNFRTRTFISSSLALKARSKTAVMEAQQVQPRKAVARKRKRKVDDTLKDRDLSEDSNVSLIDESMLEMLLDKSVNPTERTPATKRQKPKLRSRTVPGAMSYKSLLNYSAEKEEEAMKMQQNVYKPLEAAAPSTSTTTPPKRPRGRPRKTLKRELEKKSTNTLPETWTEAELVNGIISPVEPPTKQKHESSKVYSDMKQYYKTVLLTAKEEYYLGTQVEFMAKCELVHEGLALRLKRLPTILEWANACGFNDEDKDFFEREAYVELRPAGFEGMFTEKDPDMFVGNGLASELGVGRGRGRVKKTPPVELEAFYDDIENKFRPKGSPKIPCVKMNTGTPTDFVSKLMNSKSAKQRMVSSNMRLVVSISRRYANGGVSIQDLVQEGSLGLTRAAEKFEPKKGFRFSTYASWWIQQAVFRALAYDSRTVRLPVHVHNLLYQIRKTRKRLEEELSRSPTTEEMARQLRMPVSKYNKMIQLTRRAISLEIPKYQQNPKDFGHPSDDLLRDTISAAQIIRDERSPEKCIDISFFHEDLKDMLKTLEEDERRIIYARYGLDDGVARTVTAVAAQMNVSKTWVRAHECKALRKLRRPWYEKCLKQHEESLVNC